jgi:cell division protein FtsW
MLAALFLLILVLMPSIGYTAGGAQRWLNLGFIRLQPGEISKVFLIVYFAAYIDANWDRMSGLFPGALVPFGVMSMFGGLLLLEPDFGTTAVLGIVVFGQLFTASRLSHLLGIGLVGVMSAALLISTSPYRMRRLSAFLDPFGAADTSGYQLIQSLIAVGSGGLWGAGLGAGKQKLFYLPAAHTDFIFAVIAEELGLLGALVVLILFGIILVRGIKIARDLADRPFHSALAIGCTLVVVVPALLNVGVVTGLLPTKGLVLPLVAYGGTAMIVHLAVMGVLIRLSAESHEH